MKTFHINVIGKAETGKTTWLKQLCGDEFSSKYIKTTKVEEYHLKIITASNNEYELVFYDHPGSKGYDKLRDALIIFVDINYESFESKKDYTLEPIYVRSISAGKYYVPNIIHISSETHCNYLFPLSRLVEKLTGEEYIRHHTFYNVQNYSYILEKLEHEKQECEKRLEEYKSKIEEDITLLATINSVTEFVSHFIKSKE